MNLVIKPTCVETYVMALNELNLSCSNRSTEYTDLSALSILNRPFINSLWGILEQEMIRTIRIQMEFLLQYTKGAFVVRAVYL